MTPQILVQLVLRWNLNVKCCDLLKVRLVTRLFQAKCMFLNGFFERSLITWHVAKRLKSNDTEVILSTLIVTCKKIVNWWFTGSRRDWVSCEHNHSCSQKLFLYARLTGSYRGKYYNRKRIKKKCCHFREWLGDMAKFIATLTVWRILKRDLQVDETWEISRSSPKSQRKQKCHPTFYFIPFRSQPWSDNSRTAPRQTGSI